MGSWLELGVGLRLPDQLGSMTMCRLLPKRSHCQAPTLGQAPAKAATWLVAQRMVRPST